MRALLLHNPTAGTGGHDKDDILAALKLAGFETRYASTKKEGAAEALREKADLLVVGGGDGTVRLALTRLGDLNTPVALLPLGSANNIARSLGIAGTPSELAESWRLGRTLPFDVGTVTRGNETTAFVEAFGVGVMPETIRRRAKEGKADGADDLRRGRKALRKALQQAAPLDATLTIDGIAVDGQFLGIEVLNIGFTGPGLPLACDADPGDRLLDVVCIAADRRDAFIDWIDSPLDCEPPVTTHRAGRVEIAWRDAPSRIDDRASGPNGPEQATVALAGRPVRILMPAADPLHTHAARGSRA